MNRQSIVLRAANPTLDDGLAFGHYANEASEGFFHFFLGGRAEQIMAAAFSEPDHDLSYQNVTFAERDEAIVGMIAGYTAQQHRRSSPEPLKRAAGRWNLRMRVVQFLFSPMMGSSLTSADDDFYIQFIAVDKERRGDGVGSLLMDAYEERLARPDRLDSRSTFRQRTSALADSTSIAGERRGTVAETIADSGFEVLCMTKEI